MNAWRGPLLAVLGVLGFSFKAILIKLAYAWAVVDPVSLLTLRMLYSAPFFVAATSAASCANIARECASPVGRPCAYLAATCLVRWCRNGSAGHGELRVGGG